MISYISLYPEFNQIEAKLSIDKAHRIGLYLVLACLPQKNHLHRKCK